MPETDVGQLQKLLKIAGNHRILEYRGTCIPDALVELDPEYYSPENGHLWVVMNQFRTWLTHKLQAQVTVPRSSPRESSPPLPLLMEGHSSYQSTGRLRYAEQRSSSPISLGSDNSFPAIPSPSKTPTTRKRKFIDVKTEPSANSDVIEITDDDSPCPKKVKAVPSIKITRQLCVDEIARLTEIPSCWTVPPPGSNVAYELDLTGDEREWKDKSGALISMAGIIKSQDQDSWKEGTGGSKNGVKMIDVLDGITCQRADHICGGIYHCDQLDMALLQGCERYMPDPNQRKDLWEAERQLNEREGTTTLGIAAMFYKEAHSTACEHELDGEICGGTPVMRRMKEMSYDGKNFFIGCQGWRKGDKAKVHRFISIPRNVDEDVLLGLFQKNGTFDDDDDISKEVESSRCAFVTQPKNGAKGKQTCPYTHVNRAKEVVQGRLIHRKCQTKITIFSPVDRSIRRAIVLLRGAHNHPMPPSTKLSRDGRDQYQEAGRVIGVTGLTMVKVDKARSTQEVFKGRKPSELDPALAIARNRRKVIQALKKETNPEGNGLAGVLARMREQQNLPSEKQYVHQVSSEEGTDVIVTMLPGLACLIHHADMTLHDNTYKRAHGIWKEWEVVIWHSRLNMRVTVARIYSTHETREAFRRMWKALWDTVERVTKEKVKFKFLDGTGLKAILVNGNKPQVDACGDDLLERNNPAISGIHDTDPQVIVQRIIRTCLIHLDRFFTALADHVPQDVLDHVRKFLYLKTEGELDAFKKWCEESPHKKLRDWYTDKKRCLWFFPSVNMYFSKIPREDWMTTPGDTNLNESAHPYTNIFCGTNLSLLDAIQTAYDLDLSVEDKINCAERDHILPNQRNTVSHRLHHNQLRRDTRARKASERKGNIETLDDIELELQAEVEAHKSSNARTHELREKKKQMQEVKGNIKRRRAGKADKGKSLLPDIVEDDENVINRGPGQLTICRDFNPDPLHNFELDPGLDLQVGQTMAAPFGADFTFATSSPLQPNTLAMNTPFHSSVTGPGTHHSAQFTNAQFANSSSHSTIFHVPTVTMTSGPSSSNHPPPTYFYPSAF